ncbi:MAG: hypothetical protein JXM70_06795, partial [Pirellulales bacterium]|nr:hypothetical protein [Pirellulales bacterium]
MFDRILEKFGSFAPDWATWQAVSILDAAIMLALIAIIWLLARNKTSAQFGYCLFLLVLLKLLVPLEIVVPESLARWTPAQVVAKFIPKSPAIETLAAETLLAHESVEVTVENPPVEHLLKEANTAEAPDTAQIPNPLVDSQEQPITTPIPKPQAMSPVPPVTTPIAKPHTASFFTFLMLIWTACSSFMFGRFLLAQIRFHLRLKAARPLDTACLDIDFAELCARIGIRRPVRIVETEAMASPAVWGIRRPVVILPSGMSASLAPKQLEWILLHELAHIRRHDLVVTCLQRLVTIVHFLNPAVWLANRAINRLREYACDDMALALTHGSPIESGEAFMHVVTHAAKARPRLTANIDAALGVFDSSSRTTCFQRLSRLLDTNRSPKVRLGVLSICTLLLAAVLTLPQIRAGADKSTVEKPTVEETTEAAQDKKATPENEPPKAAKSSYTKKAAKISGRSMLLTVVDDKDKAVPGAKVQKRVWPVSGERFKFSQNRCDEKGRFRVDLPDKTPDHFTLTVTAPGHAPFYASWSQTHGSEPIPDSYTMRLDTGRLIGGIVQDEDGKAIVGAKIHPSFTIKQRAENSSGTRSGQSVKTDAQGRWIFDGFPAKLQQVRFFLTHPAHIDSEDKGPVSKFALSEDAKPKSVSVMKRGLIITGTVSDENGQPVENAVVRYHQRGHGGNEPKVSTDKNGSYRFAG